MRRCLLALLVLWLMNGTPVAWAQWQVGVTYQHASRGHQWDHTSSGPHTGFGLEFGRNLYPLSNQLSLTGRLEVHLQKNAFPEWSIFDGRLLMETDQHILRGGVLTQAELHVTSMLCLYGGMGGGIERFHQDVTQAQGTERIDWIELPQDRLETSPYLTGALGVQLSILEFLRPFAEGRGYWTLHPNRGLILGRNRIPNVFGAFEFGFRLEL